MVNIYRDAIKAAGGKTLLYSTWISAWGDPNEQEARTEQFIELRDGVGGDDISVVPVGQAWAAARLERPDLMLNNVEDGFHPGLYGHYLTSCVYYAAVTGKSPVGHPCHATIAGQVPIPDEMAEFLQRIAWETVQKYADRCNLQLD